MKMHRVVASVLCMALLLTLCLLPVQKESCHLLKLGIWFGLD